MFPWLAVLAGYLATKQGSADARTQAGGEILRNNAARMGGNTDMLDAQMANRQIDNQEGQQLTNLFASQLIGQLGQKAPAATGGTDVKTSNLGGAVGRTGLFESDDPLNNTLTAPGLKSMTPDEEREMYKTWRQPR